jgi:hypothetical protein
VGGEAGEGEENCPARVGARSGKNVHKLKTFSNVVVLFWRIFLYIELFFLGKKYDRQLGGGYEARNQV